MKYLLDTHTLLWWWTDDPQLSNRAREIITDEQNAIFVSAASAWEIATKFRLGKLPQAEGAMERFNELIQADGFEHLVMTYLHAMKSGTYHQAHRDPFDRMLAAQSEIENLPIISRDSALSAFNVSLVW